ncbi:MAG: hypothetical protein KDE31_28060, partial [Caldilineaceae bacterium]|nr:hypothetical protein [Caldilineaceae bacterium]
GNFARLFDASLFGVPNTADVDGIAMVSDNQFYISFNTDSVQLPGLGLVNDQDVVYYDRGTWKMFFRGSDYGFNNNARDIDAFDVTNGVLYFSLTGGASVPGVSGSNDDADIYSFDGTSFARVFDASVAGLPGNADVDGLSWHGPDDFYLSFMASTTNVPGLGAVNDENVVRVQGGNSFSLYFDGTAEGLTANGKDLDAIDVP